MRPVGLLSFWKTRNSLRTLLTDPRKLVPTILFAICIGCSLGTSLLGLFRPSGHLAAFQPDPELLRSCVFLAAVLMCVGSIDMGLGDSLLAFGMSDVDYLFPSPISRKVVLAYRLPMLTLRALSSMLVFLYLYMVALNVADIRLPNQGDTTPPWYLGPGCLLLCVGSYLNLAMIVAITVKDRTIPHRVVLGIILAGMAALVGAVFMFGPHVMVPIADFPLLRVLFFPCVLAQQGLVESVMRTSDLTPLFLLVLTYAVTLIPLFVTNVNYYEQSIVSTERYTNVRKAMRGGFAAQQASRAERFKYRATREYAVKPFGTGARAIAWAHLSAAVKRPYVNFVIPILGGFACGVVGFLANNGVPHSDTGIGVVIFFAFYSSMGFMATARTASEAAIRRRDLFDPLPVPTWQVVVANLTVPWLAMAGFCVAAGLTYGALGDDGWDLVLFGLCVLFPLRLGARMVLQYVMVLGYPDFADKIQQLLAQGVYYLLASPFVVVEVIFALPAFFLHSYWVGLITLSLLEVAFLALLVWIAGLAAAKSVSSGEPVSLFRIFSPPRTSPAER